MQKTHHTKHYKNVTADSHLDVTSDIDAKGKQLSPQAQPSSNNAHLEPFK